MLAAVEGAEVWGAGAVAHKQANKREGPLERGGGTKAARRGPHTVRASPPHPVLLAYISIPCTQVLSIPLGAHPALRTRISAFTSALLHSAPAIAGLDTTAIPDPRRAHLTLGVMALDARSERSVSTALELLSALKADILRILNEDKDKREGEGERAEGVEGARAPPAAGVRPLRVALDTVGVLKPQDGGGAHVLWVGPDVSALDGGSGRRTGKGGGKGEGRAAGYSLST
ncbi:hypothetical protein EYR40_006159 [Pleurotus pulmonarius]|nr:hypothetical protein EYR36_010782 [Pleurotus pulmonarius]KAF4599070.1 hypothetical protein EYR40_006159 [Pleurotus pulmonarius]